MTEHLRCLLEEMNGPFLAVYTRQQLIDLLSYHVVSGRYDSRELSDGLTLTTINGGTLTIGSA
jgi:uncharacterized surface protein with fasciclin (FAS1) repeats